MMVDDTVQVVRKIVYAYDAYSLTDRKFSEIRVPLPPEYARSNVEVMVMLPGRERLAQLADPNFIPTYNRDKLDGWPPGTYLGLMHGRDTPDEELEDWGFDGPVIGPLNYVHTTYAHHIKMEFVHKGDGKRYASLFPDQKPTDEQYEIMVVNELAVCGGKYYGDWCVFSR